MIIDEDSRVFRPPGEMSLDVLDDPRLIKAAEMNVTNFDGCPIRLSGAYLAFKNAHWDFISRGHRLHFITGQLDARPSPIADGYDPQGIGNPERCGFPSSKSTAAGSSCPSLLIFPMHNKKVPQPVPVHPASVVGYCDALQSGVQGNSDDCRQICVLQAVGDVFPDRQTLVLEKPCRLQQVTRNVALDKQVLACFRHDCPRHLDFPPASSQRDLTHRPRRRCFECGRSFFFAPRPPRSCSSERMLLPRPG